MALGEFVLFFCGMNYHSNPQLSSMLFFTGLGMMIAGTGFFKPNNSSMIGQLYPKGDKRVDSAYTIFYMGINVGAALGPIVCGFLGDTGNPADFKWAFLAGGIGMIISVIIQRLFFNKFVRDPNDKILGLTPEGSNKKITNPFYIIAGLALLACVTISLLYIDAKVVNYLAYLLVGAFWRSFWMIGLSFPGTGRSARSLGSAWRMASARAIFDVPSKGSRPVAIS